MPRTMTQAYADGNLILSNLPAAVQQQRPGPRTTERYVHVNSRDIVQLMAKEGWNVASVQMPKSKMRDPLFAKHQIDFRRADSEVRADRRGGYVPRMLYTNSHDGTCAASFMLGVYAFVCSNGMVIGSTYARERVRHIGETAESLITRMQALAKNTGPLFDQIDAWQAKKLTAVQAREFARLASQLRWGDAHRFDTEQVLHARREEDDASDLWTVFNRVQENTVRGGLTGLARSGRHSTSRPLSEIGATTQYNTQLWRLAEEFAAL